MYYPGTGYNAAINGENLRKEWHGSIALTNGSTISFDMSNLKERTGDLKMQCSSDSGINIGTVYSFMLNLSFKNLNVDRYALIDGVITLYADIIQIGSSTTWNDVSSQTWNNISSETWEEVGETVFTIPMGLYTIKESMQTRDCIKITAYDHMLKFDQKLPTTMDSNAKSIYAWIVTACTACGVTLGTSRYDLYAMPNGQKTFKFANSNLDVKTWRDLLSEAVMVLGANAMINRSGQLEVRRYRSYAQDAITAGGRYSSDFSDYQSYYTGIYLNYREDGVQDYQTNAATAADDTGLSYDIGYNAFMQIEDDTTRNAALKTIIDGVKDCKYVPFSVTAPLNPCYDPMDVLAFDGNQASQATDIAPITSIVYHIGGKMDLHCGGEDPALQEVRSKEAKAISSMDNGSNAYYDDHFFMEIGSAPSAATVVTAGTAAKVGELLFYAEQAVVTVQIAYTVTYVLSDDVVVEAEIFVDSTSVYKVQDTQDAGANTLSVVTGYDFNGDGSHSVEVYLNVIGA